MSASDLRTQLNEAAAHWNFIERRLKEAEQITTKVVTPAINELRYAGRQIVDAWAIYASNPPDGSEVHRDCLNRVTVAQQYLLNADHDITDGVGLWLNIRITSAIEEFGFGFLTKHIPQFEELDRQLKELQDIVATSRQNRALRVAEYRRAADHLIPNLLQLFQMITVAEEIGVARKKKWQLINTACVALGVIGSLASVLSIIIAWDQVTAYFRGLAH